MKKRIGLLLLLFVAAVSAGRLTVRADAVEERPYLSLGADLSAEEEKKVLSLLGVDPADLEDYTIVRISNKDEHDYLDSYLSSSVIGSRALSSVLVEKAGKGEGISVSTQNISYCTEKMYINALTTAGITDADVKVAGPFRITGTAALVGAMKAYEEMTGEEISGEQSDAATNELVVTGALAEDLGDAEEAEDLVAEIKERVIKEDIQDSSDIQDIIDETCKERNITLTDDQKQQISDLMKKIDKLDINVEDLKKQAGEVYEKIKNIDSGGFFDKLMNFLNSLLEKFL